MGLEKAVIYGIEPDEETHRLTFAESRGFVPGAITKELGALASRSRTGWGLFHPSRPEPEQRNRAITFAVNAAVVEATLPSRTRNRGAARSLGTMTPQSHPSTFAMMRAVGVLGLWELRVLVCEGEGLLAWLGGFRTEPFGATEPRFLQSLTPALERRLSLEQLLDQGAWLRKGLATALEEVPSAALIIDEAGRVKHANAAGQDRLDRHLSTTRMELRAALTARAGGPFRLTRIGGVGSRSHWLAVAHGREPLDGQVARAVRRWALTARQADVLGLLLRGQANKAIAIHLGCAVRTVEQHVTAVLEKAGVDTRAALAAKFLKES